MAEDIPVSGTISDDLVDIRCPVLAIFGADSGLADQVPHWSRTSRPAARSCCRTRVTRC
jgi:hypothetical protein